MRSTSARAVLAAAALAAAACSEQGLPPPVPTSIDPARAYPTVDVPVVIRGEAFYVVGSQDAGGAGGDRLSAGFRAWLGGAALLEVERVDDTTLDALVPAGLPAGTYDLVVEGPTGARGALAAAYEVVTGTAPVLLVDPVAVPTIAPVGAPAEIRVRVTNASPAGGPTIGGVHLLLKRVENGKATSTVPGAPPGQPLVAGQFFDAAFPVSTSSPGPLEFEARASGIYASAAVVSERVRVTLEVVAP